MKRRNFLSKVDFIVQLGDFCFAEAKSRDFMKLWDQFERQDESRRRKKPMGSAFTGRIRCSQTGLWKLIDACYF